MKGPTLQELVEADFGAGSEKTAAAAGAAPAAVAGADDGLAKLAQELSMGDLLGGDAGAAGAAAGEAGAAAAGGEAGAAAGGSEKVASIDSGLGGLFDDVFPDDALGGGSQKVASAEDLAQEALGAASYDAFADRFGMRVEKMAAEVMSGSATVSSPTASIGDGNPHGDSRPAQTQPQNRPADAGNAIDTSPQVDNQLPPQKGDHVTGSEQQGEDATEKAAAAYAFRKHLLLSQMQG